MFPSKIRSFCGIYAFAFLMPLAANASTIDVMTVNGVSVMANLAAPNGGGVTNSLQVGVSPDEIKLFGDIGMTSTTSTVNGVLVDTITSTLGNTLDVVGDVTLNAGDAFSLAYDYNVTLVGGGTVTLTTTATTDFGGQIDTLTSVETITSPGEFNFTFADLGFEATEFVSGTWTGQFSFDWVNIPSGSSLDIVIPNNSIDFRVTSATAIPEPGSLGLALACSLGLLARRRKTKFSETVCA